MSEAPFDPSSVPIPEPEPLESMGWLDIWGYAISKPSVATFRELLQDPKSKLNPYIWIGLASLLSYIISVGLQALFGVSSFSMLSSEFGNQFGPLSSIVGAMSILSLLCCAPVAALLGVLGFFLSTGLYHLLAKLFGGKALFSELAFTASTFFVPLTVISAVLASLPVVGPFLSIPVSIYSLVLFGIAINAVHYLGGGKAAAVVIIPVVVLILFGIILSLLFLAVLAPALEQLPGGINPYTY
jgi:hypothetical protein